MMVWEELDAGTKKVLTMQKLDEHIIKKVIQDQLLAVQSRDSQNDEISDGKNVSTAHIILLVFCLAHFGKTIDEK